MTSIFKNGKKIIVKNLTIGNSYLYFDKNKNLFRCINLLQKNIADKLLLSNSEVIDEEEYYELVFENITLSVSENTEFIEIKNIAK